MEGTRQEIAGPQVHDLVDLARRVEAQRERPRRTIPLPVLGKAAHAVAGAALLPGADATLGTVTFDDWLTAERP